MALKKSEKNLIIGLIVVAILGGYKLWKNKQPDPEVEKQEQAASKKAAEKKKADDKKKAAAAKSSSRPSSGGSRPSSGGGSRSSGSSSKQEVKKVSYQEFISHSGINSCWVVIDAEVYNITTYALLPENKSLKLSQYCGTTTFEDGYVQGSYEKQEDVKTYSDKVGKL